ncbi:CDC48 family AAA ATPase [Caldinitratiruptor microaerophilus]|uniref:ATPase AAA n=1 Tax=Caldinitratiruptor microaerophilus TaxID=671077 RepID=A0AA35G8G4_9FIRM|nr:CDC48 family AAA ATPase [Caldinitratiruptor microaerophilus]BDG60995.1 ATPase AAA [Caldinitratiruptor microaerophilus]
MEEPETGRRSLRLRVAEALPEDLHRGIARLGVAEMTYLGLSPGEVVQIAGLRATVARALPADSGTPPRTLRIDGTTRQNSGVGLDEEVTVQRIGVSPARAVVLTPSDPGGIAHGEDPVPLLHRRLLGCAVVAGDVVAVPRFGGEPLLFTVTGTAPRGAVLVQEGTRIRIAAVDVEPPRAGAVTYEDVGGLDRELARVRELVELPLKYPALFRRLGVRPPRGVLLYGPPGTGKTLIARAIAADSRLHFVHVDGPAIMRKYYGESEARLREVFDEARRHAPSVIFLDELDALAPRREAVHGDVEKRVVGQLLALMDGLEERGDVIVVGATNIPELLDPALRRPGRFDREIPIPVPDRDGRLAILRIHTRGMALAADVDLEELADVTHGFVGADLAALCREAGMAALRRLLPEIRLDPEAGADSGGIQVTMADFRHALGEVEPSATRELVLERPRETWEHVGGLSQIRTRLRVLVERPLRYGDLLAGFGLHLPRGILFTGPAGTGKTLVARALASSVRANFIGVEGPSLFRKWMGETEKALRDLFRKARQASPCILFIDELDALAPARGAAGATEAGERAVSQLLAEMDGIREHPGVLVIAATNRPDRLEPALLRPGRFDYILEFPLPDVAEREEILAVHTRRLPLAGDVDLGALAEATAGWSGAELRALCQRAALLAADEWFEEAEGAGGRPPAAPGTAPAPRVGARHFRLALAEMEGGSGGMPPPRRVEAR